MFDPKTVRNALPAKRSSCSVKIKFFAFWVFPFKAVLLETTMEESSAKIVKILILLTEKYFSDAKS